MPSIVSARYLVQCLNIHLHNLSFLSINWILAGVKDEAGVGTGFGGDNNTTISYGCGGNQYPKVLLARIYNCRGPIC
jgi:hypothetical protein